MNHVDRAKVFVGEKMADMTFDTSVILSQPKNFKKFKEEVAKLATVVMKEIYTTKRDFRRIHPEDLMSHHQVERNSYHFDFSGEHGMVRVTFEKDTFGILHFSEVQEKVFEEAFCLFEDF